MMSEDKLGDSQANTLSLWTILLTNVDNEDNTPTKFHPWNMAKVNDY